MGSAPKDSRKMDKFAQMSEKLFVPSYLKTTITRREEYAGKALDLDETIRAG